MENIFAFSILNYIEIVKYLLKRYIVYTIAYF